MISKKEIILRLCDVENRLDDLEDKVKELEKSVRNDIIDRHWKGEELIRK